MKKEKHDSPTPLSFWDMEMMRKVPVILMVVMVMVIFLLMLMEDAGEIHFPWSS